MPIEKSTCRIISKYSGSKVLNVKKSKFVWVSRQISQLGHNFVPVSLQIPTCLIFSLIHYINQHHHSRFIITWEFHPNSLLQIKHTAGIHQVQCIPFGKLAMRWLRVILGYGLTHLSSSRKIIIIIITVVVSDLFRLCPSLSSSRESSLQKIDIFPPLLLIYLLRSIIWPKLSIRIWFPFSILA